MSETLVPEFHQGDPVNRHEHRRVAPCCSVMAREFLDTFGEPRTLAASPSSDTRPGLREAADAALTDFIYAHGSDFDEAEWPGMTALRAALAAESSEGETP